MIMTNILNKVKEIKPDKEKIHYCYLMMDKYNNIGVVEPSLLLSFFKYIILYKDENNLDEITTTRLCYLIKQLYAIDSYDLLTKESEINEHEL